MLTCREHGVQYVETVKPVSATTGDILVELTCYIA